jgi:hypothetical protein
VNRYQQEVAEMDRRHAVMVRVLSFVGAALLIVAALWGAGLPPSEWWATVQHVMARSVPEPKPVAAPGQPADFSRAPAAAPSTGAFAAADSSPALTPQPLYLLATSPGRNKNEGTAQLGTDPTSAQTYMGGAILANGARLTEIHREYVVLTRGNESATLPLFRRNRPARHSKHELLAVGGEQATPAPAPLQREVFTDYMRPSPVYDGEMLRGYQVYAGIKAGVFSQLGLQAGDVITALNDVPLSEPHQAMELFAELARGTTFTATIQRKGKVARVALDGALIAADQQAAQSTAAQTAPPIGPPSI